MKRSAKVNSDAVYINIHRCVWNGPDIYKYSSWVSLSCWNSLTWGISPSNARPWIQGRGWTADPRDANHTDTQKETDRRRRHDVMKWKTEPIILSFPSKRSHSDICLILFTIQHVQGSNQNTFIIQRWWSYFRTLALFLHFNVAEGSRRDHCADELTAFYS